MFKLIVAFDKNFLIGADGKLPWRIPEDLKFFKSVTTGNSILVGRKTWDLLPVKPLPNRLNMVLTNRPCEHSVSSIEEAIKVHDDKNKGKDIFVIGGAGVYREVLSRDLVDEMVVSHVEGDYAGDTYFPKIAWEDWRIVCENRFSQFTVRQYVNRKRPVL